MKKTFTKASYSIAALMSLAIALPAFAFDMQGNTGVHLGGDDRSINVSVKTDAEIQSRASSEIDKRIKDLQGLVARISGMERLSASVKASLTTDITNEITALTALKTKINSETGDVLKADAKSVTGSYRIYMVVMPQIRIMAAADRAQTVAGMLMTLSGKLQVRITAAQSLGKDVTTLTASLADVNAKITDAKIQAQAAFDLVVNLSPDQKDKAKMDANQQALASARLKLKAAEADLKAAHVGEKAIIKALREDKKNDKEGHENDRDGVSKQKNENK